jgi:hypothetical protein
VDVQPAERPVHTQYQARPAVKHWPLVHHPQGSKRYGDGWGCTPEQNGAQRVELRVRDLREVRNVAARNNPRGVWRQRYGDGMRPSSYRGARVTYRYHAAQQGCASSGNPRLRTSKRHEGNEVLVELNDAAVRIAPLVQLHLLRAQSGAIPLSLPGRTSCRHHAPMGTDLVDDTCPDRPTVFLVPVKRLVVQLPGRVLHTGRMGGVWSMPRSACLI